MPSSREARARYRAKLAADPERVARRREYQRAYYADPERVARRQDYLRAYHARRRANRASVQPTQEAAPPPREASAKVPRRDATLDPIGALHARLVALAPAYAWRVFDDGIVGRDGKVKLRVLVSGVIYVGAERKNLKKWLQSIGISGEIAL